jgi:hypothetical protein
MVMIRGGKEKKNTTLVLDPLPYLSGNFKGSSMTK